MRKPTAILTGDIHLRDDSPTCRTDDYTEAQAKKIAWLRGLQLKHGCPILDAGDLFNKSKPSHQLMNWSILKMPDEFYTVPGNHDLPSHNLKLIDKSGLGILWAAGVANVMVAPEGDVHGIDVYPFPWGSELEATEEAEEGDCPKVAICHVMTYEGDSPWPGCTDPTATQLLRKMKGYDLVLTGHNHKAFVIERQGRLLVNPGSLMRSNADQADFKPRVYLWYAEDNTVEAVYVPIEEGVVNRDHIDKVADRDERIDAFVDRLSDDYEISLSFRKNVEEFFSANRVRGGVEKLVWEAIDGA